MNMPACVYVSSPKEPHKLEIYAKHIQAEREDSVPCIHESGKRQSNLGQAKVKLHDTSPGGACRKRRYISYTFLTSMRDGVNG
jgi:hypothetical protein